MILPFRVNTLTCRSPWANLALIALNILAFVLLFSDVFSERVIVAMILSDWSPLSFLGYQFLHAGLGHIVGNMITLWVFGNALNGVLGDADYLLAYLTCGIFAGVVHLIADGSPVVGASGAIAGVTGLYLAIYPSNEVSCLYWFFRPGVFELKGYILICIWLAYNIWSAVTGSAGIAWWAHIGGLVAGFLIGLLLLRLGRVHRGDYDHPTAPELFART